MSSYSAAVQAHKHSARYHFFTGAISEIDYDRIIRETREDRPGSDFILVVSSDTQYANVLVTEDALNKILNLSEAGIELTGAFHQPAELGWNNIQLPKAELPDLILSLQKSRQPQPVERVKTTVTII